MACKVPNGAYWRGLLADRSSDDTIAAWFEDVDLSHRMSKHRRGYEWCLIRALTLRQARKRGML